jgi:hypothetical protein
VKGDAQGMIIHDEGFDWASVEFSLTGEFEVEVKVFDGEFEATDIFNITVEKGTDIKSYNVPTISLYPNPATDNLNLELHNIKNAEITVFNVLGTQVFKSAEVNENMNINLSGFEEGLYFIIVEGQGYSITRKFNILK